MNALWVLHSFIVKWNSTIIAHKSVYLVCKTNHSWSFLYKHLHCYFRQHHLFY